MTQIRRALKDTPLEETLTDSNGLGITLRDTTLDIASFEELSRSEELTDLKAASEVYGGEFLEGFHINEPEFQNWATSQRTYYYDKAVHTQKKIIDHLIEQNILDEAVCRVSTFVCP